VDILFSYRFPVVAALNMKRFEGEKGGRSETRIASAIHWLEKVFRKFATSRTVAGVESDFTQATKRTTWYTR